MTKELDMTKARKIPPRYDNRGNPTWKTRLSAPDDSFAQCLMVPDRIIPVIFVPGVMGSNLKGVGQADGIKWRLDSDTSMLPWLGRGPKERKRMLTPTTMEVDDGGAIPEGTQQHTEELRRRHWGEVGAMSYAPFLVWLENALNDYADPHAGERVKLMHDALKAMVGEQTLSHEEIALSYRYRFPVHACGYNWLASNVESATRLGHRINEVIKRYSNERKMCEKVILVTHSMGGLVARHCSEIQGHKSKILGIVHGVMPAIGAAAVYRRFKAGTEGDYVPSEVLGNDAAEMTAVLSSAPGPLQLLPTPEYGNGWLKIQDGNQKISLPEHGDPYGEIYAVRSKWWSMCEDQLVNPLNIERDPKKRQVKVDADWNVFADVIAEGVKPFHEKIAGKYHSTTYAFFGSHTDYKAYGNVVWSSARGPVDATLFNERPVNSIDARQLPPDELKQQKRESPEIKQVRTVDAMYTDGGWFPHTQRSYIISQPDEPGDGTVPHRSGIAAKNYCKSFLQVKVGHEPAYNLAKGADNLRACRFTLRAIVSIAQLVQKTTLKYC
jgi:hypothetical protein